MGGAYYAGCVVFEKNILKRFKKALRTLRVNGPIFILSTKLESAGLIYPDDMIKVVCDSNGLIRSMETHAICMVFVMHVMET